MPSYRGNIGNLLQHWVLCELVQACNNRWRRLRFVDAYSMAPLATERAKPHWSSELFDHARVRANLDSIYERTWSDLDVARQRYPNSAAFTAALWSGPYSMVLCELDGTTISELLEWKRSREAEHRCGGVEVAEGDWRDRFGKDISEGSELLFISFDPDMVTHLDTSDDGRKMTMADLRLVARVVPPTGSVIMQLSTYSVNGSNSQAIVTEAVSAGLEAANLRMLDVIKPDEQMMSMVLGRACPDEFVAGISSMPERFESWLFGLKTSLALAQPNKRLHPTATGQQLPPLPPLPRSRRG